MSPNQKQFRSDAEAVIARIKNDYGIEFKLVPNTKGNHVMVYRLDTIRKQKMWLATTDDIKPENAFYWMESYEIALMTHKKVKK